MSVTVILRPSLTSQSLPAYEIMKDVPRFAWAEMTLFWGDSESFMLNVGGIEIVQALVEVRTKVTGTLPTFRVTGDAASSGYGM